MENVIDKKIYKNLDQKIDEFNKKSVAKLYSHAKPLFEKFSDIEYINFYTTVEEMNSLFRCPDGTQATRDLEIAMSNIILYSVCSVASIGTENGLLNRYNSSVDDDYMTEFDNIQNKMDWKIEVDNNMQIITYIEKSQDMLLQLKKDSSVRLIKANDKNKIYG